MKTIAVAFFALLASVNAKPSELQGQNVKQQDIAYNIIDSIIESVFEQIRERDPLVVEYAEGDYNFPIDGVFSADAYVRNFALSGFGSPDNYDFGFSGNSITFDINFPKIGLTVDEAVADLFFFSLNGRAEASGRFNIKDFRCAGRLDLGVSKNLLDGLHLQFSLGGMESDLYVNIFGRDISGPVNSVLGDIVPAVLIENEELLNRFFGDVIMAIISRLT